MGFSVLASVPDTSTVYPLLGRAQDSLDHESSHYTISTPKYLGAQYDASTTNLTYTIPSNSSSNGGVEVVLSFLSPITPTSTLRQSIPASYLSIHAKGSFDVNIYVDVNGEKPRGLSYSRHVLTINRPTIGQWVSGDRGSHIKWNLHERSEKESAKLKTWRVKRSNEELFTEKGDRAEWGTLHFTGPANAAHQCGTSAVLRHRFAKTGKLNNTVDDSFRTIMDEEPVFAFSKYFKLGNTSEEKEDSVLFTISHIQVSGDWLDSISIYRKLTSVRCRIL